MLALPVKAGAISNLTDARYFAAREVAWLGFCLDAASEDAIAPMALHAIRQWIEGPAIVGEFGTATADVILEGVREFRLDAVQIGPFTTAEVAGQLSGVPLLRETIVEPTGTVAELDRDMAAFAPLVTHFVLDFEKNGIRWQDLLAGRPFDVAALRDLCSRYNILLQLPASPDEWPGILEQASPAGISVHGGAEEKTGYKSFDDLDALFDLLELP